MEYIIYPTRIVTKSKWKWHTKRMYIGEGESREEGSKDFNYLFTFSVKISLQWMVNSALVKCWMFIQDEHLHDLQQIFCAHKRFCIFALNSRTYSMSLVLRNTSARRHMHCQNVKGIRSPFHAKNDNWRVGCYQFSIIHYDHCPLRSAKWFNFHHRYYNCSIDSYNL